MVVGQISTVVVPRCLTSGPSLGCRKARYFQVCCGLPLLYCQVVVGSHIDHDVRIEGHCVALAEIESTVFDCRSSQLVVCMSGQVLSVRSQRRSW